MRPALPLLAALAGLALWASPRSADALENDLQLGLDLSYAHESGVEDGQHGAGAGLWVRWGATDAIGVTGLVAWSGQVLSPEDESAPSLRHVATMAAGFLYAVDVLRIIPYLGVMVGAAVAAEAEPHASFLVLGHGGFDFLWTRAFSTGVDVAAQLLVGEQVGPVRVVASVRLSWHQLL